MYSPLLEGIIEREKFPVVDEGNVEQFLTQNGDVVLFVAGESRRLVEVNDVAVILPELVKAFKGRLTPAVLARSSEQTIQLRYRFNAFPALVFLRHGEYLGVITRVLDWHDYLREISEILERDTAPPPAYEFPAGCGGETQVNKSGHNEPLES